MSDKTILKVIRQKLEEHTTETELTLNELSSLFDKVKKTKDTSLARNIMVLKDKMMWHKAIAAILSEILDEFDKTS